MLRVILFDLDGTLMDTAPELADALNDTLARHQLPSVDEDRVRGWIGDGARALLTKALVHVGTHPGTLSAKVDQLWDGFAADYVAHCGQRSRVHDGVRDMLRRLQGQGLRLVVLTNKESAFAHRLLALHDLAADFDLIVAGDSLPVRKPHPDVVHHALKALDALPAEALLVGDAVTDVRTARAAGIPVWLVRHGYPGGELAGADAPDGFIDHFDDFKPQVAERVTIT